MIRLAHLGLAGAGAIGAILPGAAAAQSVAWDLAQISQPGQATVYLAWPGWGMCGMPVRAGDFDGDGKQDWAMAAIAGFRIQP